MRRFGNIFRSLLEGYMAVQVICGDKIKTTLKYPVICDGISLRKGCSTNIVSRRSHDNLRKHIATSQRVWN